MSPGRRLTVALVGLVLLVLVGWFVREGSSKPQPESSAPTSTSSSAAKPAEVPGAKESGLEVTALSALPPEAAKTYKLIGGEAPMPYPKNDGVTFENREKRLPQQKSGYYKEYTVPTPGSPDRGARRLVTGSKREVYYTGDHYASFVVVDVKK
ncbi:ribonuclease N [Lentzea guizhouensis]|uniref:Ribonuclease N n=1 Tax=Lentzea guizhouensis TaxID=1586287 RepID=A0A1B2HCE8_9PSEU|nr:ribonuclease domain-containing protein [Lentzea guizhouensis]ANZ35395.1 ribonuclease N [Lentzea guizhouensis]